MITATATTKVESHGHADNIGPVNDRIPFPPITDLPTLYPAGCDGEVISCEELTCDEWQDEIRIVVIGEMTCGEAIRRAYAWLESLRKSATPPHPGR